MTQTAQTPTMVPYEVWQREHERRIEAEKDRDYYKREFFLSRKIRQAPVLKPVAKEILQELRHTQQWGTVKDPDDYTRANYRTIANRLKISPDAVTTHAERLEKLGLVEIHEHQGPKDACDRKYIQIKEEKLHTIDKLEDPAGIVPKQGGNRYICTKCESPDVDVKTEKRTTIRCNCCHHEEIVEDTIGKADWKPQFVHKRQKTQKQLAFERETVVNEETGEVIEAHKSKHFGETEKQLAAHSVYTEIGDSEQKQLAPDKEAESQKQLAFEGSAELELQSLDQWVVWRYGLKKNKKGKLDKLPYDAKEEAPLKPCDYTDPESWATITQVLEKYHASQTWARPYDGIGFCFKKGGGIVGIDRDENVEPLIHSYSQFSVSGSGIHQFARGSIPRNIKRSDLAIEMYDHDRFFTWTENYLEDMPLEMLNCQAELDALFAEIAPPEVAPVVNHCYNSHCSLSDEEILAKAKSAKNGEKFWRLYNGIIPGYGSQSEADLALCKMLAYWTDNSVSTIDSLFRQSRLMRDKWDEKHGWETYGEMTIRKAIGQKDERAAS